MAQYTEPNGFKGTPGDWRFDEHFGIIHASKPGIIEGGKHVCEVSPTGDWYKPNAALLCNAKEVIKALQFLVNQVETGGDYHPAMMNAKDVLDRAIPKH